MNFDEGYRKVVEKASTDTAYRARLIKNANEAIKEVVGSSLPAGHNWCVYEDTATTHNFVLPPLPSAKTSELSDVELEQVAGGKGLPGLGSLCKVPWPLPFGKPFTFC